MALKFLVLILNASFIVVWLFQFAKRDSRQNMSILKRSEMFVLNLQTHLENTGASSADIFYFIIILAICEKYSSETIIVVHTQGVLYSKNNKDFPMDSQRCLSCNNKQEKYSFNYIMDIVKKQGSFFFPQLLQIILLTNV